MSASAPMSRPKIIFLQTADPVRYLPMFKASSRTVRRYCELYGYEYQSYLGVRRGFHPWHAAFNRIFILRDLIAAGFDGWVFYLDADAFIRDFGYDVAELISSASRPLIADRGKTDAHWDVNNGVFLLNLGSPAARRLVDEWYASFMLFTDMELAAAADWGSIPHDQALLQKILQRDEFREINEFPRRGFLNYPQGSFVGQVLRENGTVEDRTKAILLATDEALRSAPAAITHVEDGAK